MKLKPLKLQVVVVLGASSGIGRATAIKFARAGSAVIAAARSQIGIESLVDEVRSFGGEIQGVICDTTVTTDLQKVADTAISNYGRIDTWVQNASVLDIGSFQKLSESDFERIIDVNLTGVARAAWVCLPHLKQSQGAFIVVSSVGAKRGIPWMAAYSASKHGVDGLLSALRSELISENANVSITSIQPSSINTPIYNKCKMTCDDAHNLHIGPGIKYHPDVVANSILYAAEHPVRDLIVGDFGVLTVWMNALAPRLTDWIFGKIGHSMMETDELRPQEDNLYKPMDHGDYETITSRSKVGATRFSLYNMIVESPFWPGNWFSGTRTAAPVTYRPKSR